MHPVVKSLPKKYGPRRESPVDRIEAALQNGLAKDSSEFTEEPVYKELAELSKVPYTSMMDFWAA